MGFTFFGFLLVIMSDSRIQVQNLTENVDHQIKLLGLQNQILEHIVQRQKGFQDLLDELCVYSEQLISGALASVMLFDDGTDLISIRSAPSAPDAIKQELAGLKPSLNNGSCANAVFTGKPTFVSDTFCDSSWTNIRHIAEGYQIKSCWSFPVIDVNLKPIGSFALSSMENRLPDEFQKKLLSVCAHLVSLICQREEHKEELWNLAHHDPLTGLPNRLFLDDQLEHSIKKAHRNESIIALMFFDLDNFKDINDSFGHEFGDKVLLKSMDYIKSCLREGDLVTRHGGDEFLILLENITDQLAVDTIAQKILDIFSSSLLIEGQKIKVSFSIGISFYPNDASDSQQLLKNADIAMYQAKKKGKNGMQYFEPKLAEKIEHKVLVEQELRESMMADEFELYYQPQFVGDTDEMDSIEVLIRWNHPKHGLLYPDSFLPIAEKSNLIREISIYVFKHACEQGSNWISEGFDIPKIAVNFSTAQLTECCAERLDLLLEAMDFPPEKMEIEVTETLVMNRGKEGINELQKMRSLGVTLAMDDFGTGYSSLSQLKSLPMDKIKIDRSFVKDLETNPDDKIIAKTIIAMGKNMGLKIVAEGVETQGQQEFLLENGCDIIQGYYRGYPVPKAEIEKLFKTI